MKITNVNLEGHELVVYYVIDNYYLGLFLKDGPLRTQGSWPISFISDKTNLEGENGVKEIIEGIKNVKITKEEHDKKAKREEEDLEGLWEEDEDYITINGLQSDQAKELFTKEQLSQTYYSWSGGELGYAHSYSDITVCFDNFSDKEEYYKTSEVLEVLEKWKEALERWNNPEEKKKMIEEYERKKKEE